MTDILRVEAVRKSGSAAELGKQKSELLKVEEL